MIALQIENVKNFMNRLLLKDTFDRFLVSEAQVTTFTTFSIDGQFHPEFYSDDDVTDAESKNIPDGEQVSWRSIRPFCLQIIKGKRLPVSFHFVLQLPSDEVNTLLEENGLNFSPEDIFGLYMNIQYRSHVLTVTTGSSLRVFSRDKSLDQAWDRMVQEFLTVEGLD